MVTPPRKMRPLPWLMHFAKGSPSLLVLVLLLTACSASGTGGKDPAGKVVTRAPAAGGAVGAAQEFVLAVNGLDAERAAELIDWDIWVAEDARLQFLVAELRRRTDPLTASPTRLESRPIAGSTATLREILAASDPGSLLARIARERFKAAMAEDFAPERRAMDARLASWNLDRIDQSATILMPNGRLVEMALVNRDHRWRLVPRWYP